jgi:L-amino acid N-acyltransferase YncA
VPLVVRLAVAEDAAAIADVHILSWRETYTRLLPAGALDDLDDERPLRIRRWTDIIGDDVTTVVVAERDGEIVGWASASAGRHDDAPRPLELEGIYVRGSEHGLGTGQALLDATVGDRRAYLWVAADNPRAHAFSRRNGFVDEGVRAEHPLHGHQVAIARFLR